MSGPEEAFAAEVPEPVLEGLLKKLAWALRQEPLDRVGAIPRYGVDRRFIEAAGELIREAAQRHPESYRRHMHGN